MCFFDKNKPLDIHSSRDLPHWNQNGVIQFVTFRLADSLPQSKIVELNELKERFESQHPKPWTPETAIQYAKLIGPIQNELLDKGYGSCVLKRQDARDILSSSILYFDGLRYDVLAFVIMPNHVHMLMRIVDGYKLEDIMHSIKSFSAKRINKLLNSSGKRWLKENWDRIIRSDKHLMHCIEYIKGNPRYLKEGEYMLYVEELTAGCGPSTESTAGCGPSTESTAGCGPSTQPTAGCGPSTPLTAGCGPSTEEVWSKMIGGEVYDATHGGLVKRLEDTREKIWEFNQLRPSQKKEQHEILHSLLGGHGENYHFNQPFRCDYGCNVFIGENFFANFNLTILDEAEVRMGDNCFIGPNVSIYTACHPLDAETRNTCVEWAEPVRIGNNVWIGGSATILPGVTIGNNVVIGAGAVVTKSFGDNVVIGGNPAKVIKYMDGPHPAVGVDGPPPAVDGVDGPHPAVDGVDGPHPAVDGVDGPHPAVAMDGSHLAVDGVDGPHPAVTVDGPHLAVTSKNQQNRQ